MELNTIDIPSYEARKLFGDYAKSVRARNEKKLDAIETQQLREDEELMNCYRWLKKHDEPIINIVQALKHAGVDDQGRPNLAVSRADFRQVRFQRCTSYRPKGAHEGESYKNVYVFARWCSWTNPEPQHDKSNVVLPISTFKGMGVKWDVNCRAIVPTVPIHIRPNNLAAYHILWEAEWENVPVDPFLLRRVGRWHFAVMAQWDLTELERGVLEASRVKA